MRKAMTTNDPVVKDKVTPTEDFTNSGGIEENTNIFYGNMSALKSECRKFSPNLFNKTKCQNCFRTKDGHSVEALENNRASRIVSKCGYLFVAPDWDFNVSINRTKRWQRRWFVLFDDGELTYALDEFPDTIPQGTIDMNRVLEVCDAEGVTGNEYSISIATPDKVHFIKGTSKEESKWWFDALTRVLPRHLSRGKHKRNATFPCGKATIPTNAVISQDFSSEDDLRLTTNNNSLGRPKFLSSSEIPRGRDDDWIFSNLGDEDEGDVFPGDEDDVELHNAINELMSAQHSEELHQDPCHDPDDEKYPKDPLSQLEELDARRRNRRYLKRENRVQRNQRSRNDGVSKMIPAKNNGGRADGHDTSDSSAIAAAEKLEYLESIHSNEDEPERVGIEGKEKLATPSKEETRPTKTTLRKSESLKSIPSEMRDHVSGLRRYHSFKGSPSHRKIKGNSTSLLKRSSSKVSSSVRPTEFIRTGWLMRLTLSKDWSRHWFVLRDSQLTYYRDPSAEHCGIMDGILDLNQVSTIRDTDLDRYYAFSLRMWDGKKHVLAAETADFRSMWIQALHYASNLWSSASKEDFACTEIILPEHNFHDRTTSPASSRNRRRSSSSSESELSDDQSEYFSLVDEDEVSELSSSPRTLPPSPPINRNMMSLVKEKSRTRSSSGIKTPPTLASMETDQNVPQNDNQNQNDSSFSVYKDTLDHLQEEDMDSSHKVKPGDRIISPVKLSAESQSQLFEDSEMLLKLDFKASSSKDENSPEKVSKIQEEASNKYPITSTPKSENLGECRMCFTVKSQLVAAKEEIRRLKKELKEAHTNFDNLEMFSYKLAQDMKLKEDNYNSQISLMTAKIDDLTSKFSLAEKNYRQLKQKALKSETKERKRSSLKSREGLSLTKEYEQKLCDLEKKVGCIETTLQRDSPEVDTAENLQSSFQPKIADSSVASESSSPSASAELSPSSSPKGFFSRLQSLGTRVQAVDDLVSFKCQSESENPKILLEQDVEESNGLDELGDSWTVTLNKSLKNVNKQLDLHPRNILECQSIFTRKIDKILRWLKTALDNVCKEGNILIDEKLFLVQNLVSLLDSFCSNPSLEEFSVKETNWKHAMMLAYEAMRLLCKIDNVDSVDSLVKLDVAELAFKIIVRTLCTAFAEYENSELTNVFQLISEIPQIRFFCPIVNKLFPNSQEEMEQFSSASERLQLLNSQRTSMLKTLKEAKNSRYKSLWNTLTDIPVKDANVNKLQAPNSIHSYVTTIATSIHRIVEQQLCSIEYQSSYLLKDEQTKVHYWCSSASEALKDNLSDFINELKEQCPMIHESSVSVFELNDATLKEISCYVSELSFFSVSYSILKSLLSHTTDAIESLNEDTSYQISDHSNTILFKPNIFSETEFFSCPQCATLNNFLSYSNQEMNWSEFIEKYNFYSPRKRECRSVQIDALESNLNGVCTNCDARSSEKTAGNLKDVCNNLTCSECDNWIKKLCASEKQHELERELLESKYNKELQQLEECLIKSSEVHEQEMLQKESELVSTTAELQRLKIEYEEQIRTLKNLYEQKLHFDGDNIDENSIRQVYKSEVEDLKDMFKKGLVAIENSHYRITTEMEKKHQDELCILKAEKERALELEAQATVTALEAIKRNFAQQIKEETANIKEDLMKKLQNSEQYDDFYNKYGIELERLKAEILNMTELYSAKCTENAVLEEKVSALKRRLEEAHDELCDIVINFRFRFCSYLFSFIVSSEKSLYKLCVFVHL
ncbi:hypothetical protein JTE90_006452 [Oedothorax gibbosus]|uniref:PH domain-containing protein n=1 Tax=Oedothorax gibbosus TaxID=931172 RepID=A0AAV6UIV5_9ARAC|nr:hypothetical protein JTE90_006452 [Oedothorax gibbosus]